MKRQQIIDRIHGNPDVSVLIVGAGINGIGTFRDLALQGVDVLLVDRSDYSSGASAASSHMVHGGIRYLENGEFRLVREAVQERNRLIENAPHLVKPLPTTFPIFKWFSGIFNAPFKFLGLLDRPSERGALVIKIGMTLYDLYTRAQATVPRHKFTLRKESLAKYPKLNPGIVCTGTYYDAAMPCPERICVELINDAERETPQAMALNYASLESASGSSVTLRDHVSGETLTVKPRIVVNAAGPWIDNANKAMGKHSRFMGGTKGSHLVLDHPELRQVIGDHEFFFENKDGRIVLIFPLMDKVLIGSSDIRIDDPDSARCTEEEIEYFIEMVGLVFPGIEINRSQVVFSFSGVRPLPHSEAGFTGQISRDHSIQVLEAGNGLDVPVYSLVGGKWTTFRAFAEEVTDKVLGYLGRERIEHTADLPIGGGAGYPKTDDARREWLAKMAAQTGIPPEKPALLFERYGTRAKEFAEFIASGTDRAFEHLPGYSYREIVYIARNESVVHLDDLLLRRSLIAMLGLLTPEGLDELAEAVGEGLGWTAAVQAAEIQRTTELLADMNGVKLL